MGTESGSWVGFIYRPQQRAGEKRTPSNFSLSPLPFPSPCHRQLSSDHCRNLLFFLLPLSTCSNLGSKVSSLNKSQPKQFTPLVETFRWFSVPFNVIPKSYPSQHVQQVPGLMFIALPSLLCPGCAAPPSSPLPLHSPAHAFLPLPSLPPSLSRLY